MANRVGARLGFVVAAVLAACAGLGCGAKRPALLDADVPIVYPPPPDTARLQYLTRIAGSPDVTGERSLSLLQKILGEQEENLGRPIIKPYGIATRRGKIYVCDTMLRGVEVIDLEARTFEYFQPRGGDRMVKPVNCFVDPEGWLYVTDVGREEVIVYSDSGRYSGRIGAEELARPGDVFVEGERVWVSDVRAGKVHVYDRDSRRLLFSFPDADAPSAARLAAPANLFVAADRVYVSDALLAVVKVYTIEGEFVSTLGSRGDRFGQFARPKGVAVDREGIVYVVDAAFANVQVFDRSGRLLTFFGGPGEEPGRMWLPAKVVVDYENLDYFRQYVHPSFELKYLVLVTNQYGPAKVSIYGFVGPNGSTSGTR